MATSADEAVSVPTFRGHPRALVTLALTEVWERFSFYGMQAILVLYFTASETAQNSGLGIAESQANSLYLLHASMVYLLTLPGGWIADRVLGTRRSVLLGGIVIASGHYVMIIQTEVAVFLGLSMIAMGTGLLKANISTLLGEMYDRLESSGHHHRRDAGFSLFYMAINVGAILAPIIVGTLGERVGWHWGFGAAAIGMTFGVIQFALGSRNFGGAGQRAHRPLSSPERAKMLSRAAIAVAVAAVLVIVDVGAGTFTIDHLKLALNLLAFGVAIGYFAMILRDRELSGVERSRIKAYVFLFLAAAMFWMIVDQAGSALNNFADKQTDRHLFGWEFPASWYQFVGPVFILLMAPLMTLLWRKLGDREASTPRKMAMGVSTAGVSFLVMALAAYIAMTSGVRVSLMWLVGVYLIQSIGELMLSPVGLSATTKLAPVKYMSQMMGLWFLAASVGDAAGDQYSGLGGVLPGWQYYGLAAVIAIVCGVLLWFAASRIRRSMAGVD